MGRLDDQPDYHAGHCALLLDMMSEGHSEAAFCKQVGISRRLFDEWAESHPEFHAAHERGHTAAEAFWVSAGELGIMSRADLRTGELVTIKVNPQIWKFHMINRFGWEDKVIQQAAETKAPLSDEQATARLKELIAKSQGA